MGTDGGPDPTNDLHPTSAPAPRAGAGSALAALDAELDRVVDGLRRGDLAFVVTAAVRLGPSFAVCLAAAGAPRPDERVVDAAFALADLAADPATASWSTGELLAAAVAQVVEAPVARPATVR